MFPKRVEDDAIQKVSWKENMNKDDDFEKILDPWRSRLENLGVYIPVGNTTVMLERSYFGSSRESNIGDVIADVVAAVSVGLESGVGCSAGGVDILLNSKKRNEGLISTIWFGWIRKEVKIPRVAIRNSCCSIT